MFHSQSVVDEEKPTFFFVILHVTPEPSLAVTHSVPGPCLSTTEAC